MPARRRPSLACTSAPSEETNAQKEIQLLRWKTQEALAETRIENERLEDENESKSLRIQEILQELEDLEEGEGFDQMASMRRIPITQPATKGAKRRWSLSASLGINNRIAQDSDPTSSYPEQHDEQYENPSTLERKRFGRNMSLGGLGGTPTPFRKRALGAKNKKMVDEEILMQRLHSIQEENKKVIKKHENDVNLKAQQVSAVKITFESQELIIARLSLDIVKLKMERSAVTLSEDTPITQESMKSLSEKLSYQTGRVNELEASLREIRLVCNMNDVECEESICELRKKLVESQKVLKSLEAERLSKSEIIEKDLEIHRKRWMELTAQLGLMDRVSQKCIRRLEKKAAEGDTRTIPTILERASRALGEELTMREYDTEHCAVFQEEMKLMERLVSIVLKCGNALADGMDLLLSKELSEELLSVMESSFEVVKDTVNVAKLSIQAILTAIGELEQRYERDNTLLSDELQDVIRVLLEDHAKKALESEAVRDDGAEVDEMAVDCLGDSSDTNGISVEDKQRIEEQKESIEMLQTQEREQQEKMEMITAKVIETKMRETKEKEEWSKKHASQLGEIEVMQQEWSYKDQQIGVGIQKVEVLKQREDVLHKLLEAATTTPQTNDEKTGD